MHWVYLILAGICEIGWPIGLKIAQGDNTKLKGIIIAVLFMGMSGFLLYLAQKNIPMGTAYAVWTGVGIVGTFLVGVLLYADHSSFVHYVGIMLIVSGITCLKLAS